MSAPVLRHGSTTSARHRTTWLESGPEDGPLLVFVHGWPEMGVVWRRQLEHFGAAGWRCVAPDMRGYGGSSVPITSGAYALRELADDMVELHDALGAEPAVWVGHDWGCPVVWTMAANHGERCRAVANHCVPYLARGMALANLEPLVDRARYPEATYPVGQWDYFLYYREHFARAVADFERDIPALLTMLFRRAQPHHGDQPAPTGSVRARGGWFGEARRPPTLEHDPTVLSRDDLDTMIAAFTTNGLAGPCAWYLNDQANLALAAEAPHFGRLDLPVLFVHAAFDATCMTVGTRLADPMREDCTDLTEVVIDAGHSVMLEQPDQVNAALADWLARSVPGALPA